MAKWHLGIDVGSISVNTVVVDGSRRVAEEHYTWCRGRPYEHLLEVLGGLLDRHGVADLGVAAFTGTGGGLAARLLGGHVVNEIVAQATAVAAHHPNARSIIEMGGEDSKLITLASGAQPDAATCDGSGLEDFAMNSLCAAGTGSFLDQQARRMGLSIVGEFGELARKSVCPPRIAGRCSVFAKSDMIHLQQIATPLEDIVAGLCFAVARNFRANLARGKDVTPPVVFQGGVAANAGMVRAFREVLGLEGEDLIVPDHHAAMGAIGAVYHVLDHTSSARAANSGAFAFRGLDGLRDYLGDERGGGATLPPLRPPVVDLVKDAEPGLAAGEPLDVYLGLDIGSLSTNVVLIDNADRVVARRYLPTASRPLEAIQRGLAEIATEIAGSGLPSRVRVLAVGTTGSGRYLTGDFVGADLIQNEITAQATAAIAHDPRVDTIFEIGGQDSKYISVDQGVVVDFEMNKVCAAGTGSFLEEQAEKLGVDIQEDFSRLALGTDRPARLGDRCTVFMESDLNSLQQKGHDTAQLVGGLAYSIVYNYIQKVVGTKRIGERIFFQGGVANNRSVIAAFEAVTGRQITVPPHFDVTGAIGAAMLARRQMRKELDAGHKWKTRFKGFEVGNVPYSLDRFTCKACSNQCDIRRVRVSGEKRPLYYGGRCERWEIDDRKSRGRDIPNLFEERHRLLVGNYREPEEAVHEARLAAARKTIGIPRALMVYYQMFPFWRTFFETLGFQVVVSSPTDRSTIQRSLEILTAETCFPAEVVHGHVLDLLDRGVDFVFAPFVVNARSEPDNPTRNYNCPWVQTYPFMVRAALRESNAQARLLTPTLHFRYYERVLPADLVAFAREAFGIEAGPVRRALAAADRAQGGYERSLAERGRVVLENLPAGTVAAVILGRPYNTGDPALNLGLVDKLIDLGVMPIPMDYLPLARERILDDYYMMYWPNGQKILSAARIVARDPRLAAVYLGNFRCGPDSFLAHYVRVELAGKPYLHLEVDEHSADAGMVTRCEAFLDSLKGWRARGGPGAEAAPPPRGGSRIRGRE
jgi:predicted CoA-substrate-specific enzyme activase